MLSEKPQEVVSELLPDEGVDDGVDAAVRHAEGLRHLHGLVQPIGATAIVQAKEFLEGAQEKDDVVGSPEKKVNNHDHENEPHGLVPFLLISTPKQGFEDSRVADDHDQQRQDQAQDGHLQCLEILPEMILTGWKMRAARTVRALFLGSGENDSWERGKHSYHPGDHTCHHPKWDRPGF